VLIVEKTTRRLQSLKVFRRRIISLASVILAECGREPQSCLTSKANSATGLVPGMGNSGMFRNYPGGVRPTVVAYWKPLERFKCELSTHKVKRQECHYQ
jgi:hypothetical protein